VNAVGGLSPDRPTSEQKDVAPGLARLENVPAGLDWEAFSAAYFPGSRRHDLKAIVAYGAYRGSLAAGEQRAGKAARSSIDAMAVDEWEDEGGTSH